MSKLLIASLILMISGFIGGCISCSGSFFYDVSIGIFTGGIVAVIIETSRIWNDRREFGYLKGKYKRLKFFNNEGHKIPGTDTVYKELEAYNNNKDLNLTLNYHGEKQYSGIGNYVEGEIEVRFDLDSQNKYLGKGRYQYTKESKKIDFGEVKIQVDIDFEQNKMLYIELSNILPSGIAKSVEYWQNVS